MGKRRTRFLVGTSGWSYDHWRALFYPEGLPKSRWFQYYAEHFSTVEVNATYYRRFKDQTYYNWRDRAPEIFLYVLKTPKSVTHRKYLEDVEQEIQEFWRSATLLEEKLGLVLLQLAPSTPYDLDRLEKALRAFGDPGRVAVEFRHKRWLTDETRALLTRLRAVFCAPDSPKTELMDWVTSDAAYIRLHGRWRWYRHDYSDAELREVAKLARAMGRAGAKDVYVFFNNDFDGHAPKNARALMEMLGA